MPGPIPTPLVSIIVNNFNYEAYLGAAIDSALNQTWSRLEVIVVDDGSTDGSAALIASYGDRIKPVLKRNGGQGSAFNAGFAASQGELVIFLDADDVLYPEAVQSVVAQWQPGIVNTMFRLDLVDAGGHFLDVYPARSMAFDTGDQRQNLLKTGRYSATVTSGNAYARRFLEQALPVPENEFRICADGYLTTLVPLYGRIAAIEQTLGQYRKHGRNLWSVAGSTAPPVLFRRSIEHDWMKYRYLRKHAEALKLTLDDELGLRDHRHLVSRLSSLRLAPAAHPIAGDHRLRLAWCGIRSIWQHSEFRCKRKLMLSGWFLWVGVMPEALAAPAIAWLLATESRPKFLNLLIRRVRRINRSVMPVS